MDFNQLFYQHQLALLKAPVSSPDQRGSRFDLVRHYARRITRLRAELGLPLYPASLLGAAT